MASKKPPIKNEILADYLIDGSHELKSIGGLLASGIVSTFGVYSIVLPFFTDSGEVNTSTLNIALISFVIMLIMFDTVKRGSLTKFFNSLLKKKIISSTAKKGYLIISVFAILFMGMLDALGSYATAEKGANLYTQFNTNNSTEFQILQQNAESGKTTANNYPLILKAWQDSKSTAYQNCNDEWKGWKAKYKAKCKKSWDNEKDKEGNFINKKPMQTATGQIDIKDYKAIKDDQKGFLNEWLFTILFILLSLMTLLMQYLTISKIYDDYNEIEESLTFERIEFINDTIQEHETILAEHEQKVAEMMANSSKEKKGQDRKFQEVGEAIAITHKKKMVSTRAETVKRIANNTYVPKEESKAGFVDFSFKHHSRDNQEVKKTKKHDDYQEVKKPKKYDLEKVNIFFSDIETLKEVTLSYGEDEYTLSRNGLQLLRQQMLTNGRMLNHSIEWDDVLKALGEQPLNDNRHNEQTQKSTNKEQPFNESVITNEPLNGQKEKQPFNGVVNEQENLGKQMKLQGYSPLEFELIDLLWKGTEKKHDQLETRDNVLKVIGDSKTNTVRLRNLYKKLLKDELIYKKIAYYSNFDF